VRDLGVQVSAPKPFTSLAELREWHLGQAAHYSEQAITHDSLAATPYAGAVSIADAYRERAKCYRKMAQVHLSAAELLDETV